jgi:hypothetical protein
MKVKELINRLKEWNEEMEIEVLYRHNIPYRGKIEEITKPIVGVGLGNFSLIIKIDR